MEIGLPNEAGRVQILSIHTTGMKEHGYHRFPAMPPGNVLGGSSLKRAARTWRSSPGVPRSMCSHPFAHLIFFMGWRMRFSSTDVVALTCRFLDAAVDVDQLAKITKNYTGAEIEGVCKAAASYAFERNIDTANIDKEHSDTSNIKVSPRPASPTASLMALGQLPLALCQVEIEVEVAR